MKPRLLDLFCGAGGAGMGYHQAGFEVIGVDIEPQPRYPFEFHQADAMTFPLDGFDAIHASPPCQDHSALARVAGPHGTGWMLPATVDRIAATGLPHVVENVPGADMPGAFTLCGWSFGIDRLKRHRLFLASFWMLVPPCACRSGSLGVYGDIRPNDRTEKAGGRVRRAGLATARELLGCPWMEADELSQAIPPAYTRFIGEQLIAHLSTLDSRSVGATLPNAHEASASGCRADPPTDRGTDVSTAPGDGAPRA